MSGLPVAGGADRSHVSAEICCWNQGERQPPPVSLLGLRVSASRVGSEISRKHREEHVANVM